jgi:hypothetical protein
MPKPTVLTPAALARVKTLVRDGVSPVEIAAQIGCTLGTLRVRCSQVGISLRRRKAVRTRNSLNSNGHAGRRQRRQQRHGTNGFADLGAEAWDGIGEHASDNRVELKILVSELTAKRLHQRAALNGITGSTLAARLLTTIDRDSLYDAVLDA